MLDAKHKVQYKKRVANKLPLAKRAQILTMLCEGTSMRATARMTDVSLNTVAKLLEDAGNMCLSLHDEKVRGVPSQRVQADEIWSFCYAKNKNVAKAKAAPEEAGDVWTWTALDADSKLMISYFVGDRSRHSALALMDDLASRVSGRIQLTTDSLRAYDFAVTGAFNKIDYAMLHKSYATPPGEGKYSPPVCIGAQKKPLRGDPDLKHVSTSYVERSNLSIRMQNRRFTRLTNAFSKKFDNHVHMLAIYFFFYNFCRIHKTLRVTPAMQAGIATTVWTMEDVVAEMDRTAEPPKKRGPYKKKAA